MERKNTEQQMLWCNELRKLMQHVFLSVIQIDLLSDTAHILKSVDFPHHEGKKIKWNGYLSFLQQFVNEKEALDFTSEELLRRYRAKESVIPKELSHGAGKQCEWMVAEVYFDNETGTPRATLILRKSNLQHLQRRIIDLYVYDKCDCFVYLDAKHNSYEMIGDVNPAASLPPKKSDNYSEEVLRYIKAYVVPEEQIKVMRDMGLKHVLEQLEKNDVHSFNCGVRNPDGSYGRKLLEYKYYDKEERIILLSWTDVTDMYTQMKTKEDELLAALEKAGTDSLTGILNHQGTIDKVTFCMQEDEGKAALMFIDMDNFKSVNDTLGHIEGDRLLKNTAEILKGIVKPSDLVGRIGGDEFMVFIRNVESMEEAVEYAQKICREIRHLSVDFGFPVSSSIGIAVYPEDGTDYKTLTGSADKRVYHAKSRGKNQIAID